MAFKTKLKENSYAKLICDDTPLLLKDRYFFIQSLGKISVNAITEPRAVANVVFYSTMYEQRFYNSMFEAIDIRESMSLKIILRNKKEYAEPYEVGNKIMSTVNTLHNTLVFNRIYDFDLWSIIDKTHFKKSMLEALDIENEDELSLEQKEFIELAMKLFKRLEILLKKLTLLEDKMVRENKSLMEPETDLPVEAESWAFNKIKEDGSDEEFIKITGPTQYVLDILEFLNSKAEKPAFVLKQTN